MHALQNIIIAAIFLEVEKAERKHPNFALGTLDQAAVVAEESGELIRAALQHKYEDGSLKEVIKEAIQTAATCIRLLKVTPETEKIVRELNSHAFRVVGNYKDQPEKPVNWFVNFDFNGTSKVHQGHFTCKQCATKQVMNSDCLSILNQIQESIQVCNNCGYDNLFTIKNLINTGSDEKN